MEQINGEINTEKVLATDWLKARMKRALRNKRRREKYKQDKTEILARNKAYKATHKDTRDRSKYRKEYYLAHREYFLSKQREYRQNADFVKKHKAYMKQYHKEHGW